MQPHVLEVGSYDVNGSIRPLFSFATTYTGIDLVEGPNVDYVAHGHEFGETNRYDIVISAEMFEHNPLWRETFINMIRVCRPGGVVLFTCATRMRQEHGTTRSFKGDSPGTEALGWDYYRNLTAKNFQHAADLHRHFIDYLFLTVRAAHDLYFIGLKHGNVSADMPSWLRSAAIEFHALKVHLEDTIQPRSLHSLVLDFPMTIAERVLPNKYYLNIAHKYLHMRRRLGNRLRGR